MASETTYTPVEGWPPELAVGHVASCAVRPKGAVECRGPNGSFVVHGLHEPSQLAVGNMRACTLEPGGRIACWRVYGGDDGIPVRFNGVDDARELAFLLDDRFCVRFGDGRVACEVAAPSLLGLATDECPALSCLHFIQGIDHAIDIAADLYRLCAVEESGSVVCVQLQFPGSPSDVQQIEGFRDVRAVAVGAEHDCALSTDGHVRCFGSNEFGQLGMGSLSLAGVGPLLDGPPRGLPQLGPSIEGLDDVVSIVAHGNTTCAVTDDGRIRCWGAGIMRYLVAGDRNALHRIAAIEGATDIAIGEDVACAIRGEQEPLCWGRPRLRDYSFRFSAFTEAETVTWTPLAVDPGVTPSAGRLVPSPPPLAVGGLSFSLSGGALACRSEVYGSGYPEAARRAPPLEGLVAIRRAICGLDPGRNIVCLGALPRRTANEQLDNRTLLFDPSTVEGRTLFEGNGNVLLYQLSAPPTGVRSLAGRDALFAIDTQGNVHRWAGTMGAAWTRIEGLDGVRTLAFDDSRYCAVVDEGSVMCGAMFPLSPDERPTPVPGLTSVRALRGGDDAFCAALEDGHVSCFGENQRGVLGVLPHASPQDVREDLQRPP